MPDSPPTAPPAVARSRAGSGRGLLRSLPALGVVAALAVAGMSDVSHVVRPGENLWTIARHFATTPQALATANHLPDPNRVLAGTTLHIPSAAAPAAPAASPAKPPATALPRPATPLPLPFTSHTVTKGETLGSIAAANQLTTQVLASINGLADPNFIRIGQVLQIPLPVLGTVEGLLVYYAKADGVDPALAEGLAWQESGWQQKVVSPTGAVGVMQLEPGTASFTGVNLVGHSVDATNVQANVEAGVAFLAYLLKAGGGDQKLAVAGYYQGLASVRARGMYRATRQYVADVLALRDRFAARVP
ncbi:MAG TPA: LysM peptidoglycan-binding domain-containing protein [Actinomycetota bacterium]|nr:LysM peptidoglycan-binding domain-containing protein [Actinomycetota bacterium]